MLAYNTLKIIHIVSAAVLFGTGLGTAFYMLLANWSRNLEIIEKATGLVVKADWLFTTTSGFIQAVTGFAMIYLHGYALFTPWILGSIAGYMLAGVCWFPVVYLQIQLHKIARTALQCQQSLPQKYYRYYRLWYLLGWPAFISLLLVFYLMTVKPGGV